MRPVVPLAVEVVQIMEIRSRGVTVLAVCRAGYRAVRTMVVSVAVRMIDGQVLESEG